MGGFFGVVSKGNCTSDLFFGTDYHSHLGTYVGGMAVCDPETGFDRSIVSPIRSSVHSWNQLQPA